MARIPFTQAARRSANTTHEGRDRREQQKHQRTTESKLLADIRQAASVSEGLASNDSSGENGGASTIHPDCSPLGDHQPRGLRSSRLEGSGSKSLSNTQVGVASPSRIVSTGRLIAPTGTCVYLLVCNGWRYSVRMRYEYSRNVRIGDISTETHCVEPRCHMMKYWPMCVEQHQSGCCA